MKKLGKLTLKQLENEMTVIGSDEQRGLFGGSSVIDGVVWNSQMEYYILIDSGNWVGGNVDGWGYVNHEGTDIFNNISHLSPNGSATS